MRAWSGFRSGMINVSFMEFNLKELADELAKGKWDSKIIAPLDRGQVYFYLNNETNLKRGCE